MCYKNHKIPWARIFVCVCVCVCVCVFESSPVFAEIGAYNILKNIVHPIFDDFCLFGGNNTLDLHGGFHPSTVFVPMCC